MRDIRPILSDRCFTCHGPDSANRKTPLRFDTEAGARRAIVPGDPGKSELIRRITSDNPAQRMPPAYAGHDKLGAREIDLFRRWIEQGAPWRQHWSFVKPRRPPLPEVRDRAWPRNPIDSFVLHRVESEGLRPSPEADRATLIRRVTLDLTGLPPTPAEIDAFLADSSPQAFQNVVDRLLASPRYAERMAVRWLDAARYADTNGYQSDGERSMWRWRDWVIDAFHRNMPFDRFTVEQIAGDLLPNATLDQKIATGFHRNHRTNAEGGIVEEEFRVEYVADRVETTATVWLGLTMGCARCHDHKYDPIQQKEFYQAFAFFNNVPERGLVYNFGNEEPFVKAPTPDMEKKLAELDRKAAAAEERYAAFEAELRAAQRDWEQQLRHGDTLRWSVPDGQVLHFPLDEGAPGRVGEARRFDGRQFVDGGNAANFNYQDAFSLAAWINPEAPTGAIMSRVEDYWEGEGYGLYLKDGKVRLHINRRFTDICLRVETEASVALNRWQHVVMTYDGRRKGAGVRIYIDGQSQKLKILFDELTYPFGAKDPFRIGGGGGQENRFHGRIDDVRVFKIALTPEQASTLHLLETMNELAAIPPEARSPAQANKLALCFLDRFAPLEIRLARQALFDARTERRRYFDSIPTVMVMVESPKPRDSFILKRGAYDNPGERVSPTVPAFLPPLRKDWPANRLGLARWLVDPSNPLTARVTVNRFWQMLFGVGLVKTAEDFGSQGEAPVHPELLDWLAVEFVENGWNVKALLKTIVTSASYRQSSRLSPELLQKDPENRLLARGPRLRLPAEMVRDQALALAGLLVEKTGGPSVKPYQPAGLWQELAGGSGYKPDKGEGLYRRSLYTYWKRTVAPPSMVTFDSPNRETCTVRETRTNTPLQALNLMNDVAYVEASRKLAERMLREGGSSAQDRIAFAFRLATARFPKPREREVLGRALDGFLTHFGAHPGAALKLLHQGESPRDPQLDPVELASYAGAASLILNLDETVTKE
ncbi:MAG: DUF1553 domain-containing protein [Acidobacteria bacterium]|nr:DUF1553 domain-containing protein [Acidobacteriota bacterium]